MKDPSSPVCRTISTLLSRIGDKWTVLVVQTLGNGPRRFNELRREIPSVSQRMLTLTLRNLERDGLVSRTVTPTIPPRVDYELTELGQSLQKPICGLATWAMDHVEAIHAAQALLDRADEFARAGDPKAAMSFYQAALKGAKAGYAELGTMERLRGAQAFVQRRADEFQQSLDRAVADFRPTDTAAQTRLTHALEMLKGERSIYPQQPAVFYYPYLAQRQFFDREEFDWVPQIEAATPVIREELLALLDAGADFRPYVEDHPNRPRREFHHLNNDPSWTALYLWRDGKLVPEVADRGPRTVEALAKTPLSHIGHRTPAALFSRLEPGAHIPPHSGMLNCRLICHLPLIVPKAAGCASATRPANGRKGSC